MKEFVHAIQFVLFYFSALFVWPGMLLLTRRRKRQTSLSRGVFLFAAVVQGIVLALAIFDPTTQWGLALVLVNCFFTVAAVGAAALGLAADGDAK